MRLFLIILDLLFPPRDTEAMVARASLEDLGRLTRVTQIDADTVSLLPYRRALVRACILEAKFRDNTRAQELLGRLLADYLSDAEGVEGTDAVLVPVPLSEARRAARGYNQTERIAAKALGRSPQIALAISLLSRTRDTTPQTSLRKAARQENMRDAFRASGSIDPGHTYIVFDDVHTTGATLSAARRALLDAGAVRVMALSLAH